MKKKTLLLFLSAALACTMPVSYTHLKDPDYQMKLLNEYGI